MSTTRLIPTKATKASSLTPHHSVSKLAEMTALGLGLSQDAFSSAGTYGYISLLLYPLLRTPTRHANPPPHSPHLLAPTASDLVKYGAQDTILAGFHTDLNFLTIHGRSRYPGLHIWARNTGSRIPVKIPPGNHLLVQAGKQIEYITGGLIKAGYHEVVVNEATLAVVERRKVECPERPLVRISSTLFWHLNSDHDLQPVPELADRADKVRAEQQKLGRDEGEAAEYPPTKVGYQVQE